MLMHMFVNYLLGILGFVVLISPPLLSLFLLRRPSPWRVLLHLATTIYILWIAIAFFTASTPESSLWTLVTFFFLLVYFIAALVAGFLEAASNASAEADGVGAEEDGVEAERGGEARR